MRRLRDIRILPIVLVAVLGLATLKVVGLAIDGGYIFAGSAKRDQPSWAEEMFNFPTGRVRDTGDITGSVSAKKEEPDKPAVAAPEATPTVTTTAPVEQPPQLSASERALLERLQARRQELEARAREVDIRENLLKAAEQRIQAKNDELKAVESRIAAAQGQKGETEAAKFKSIVTMYEGMKPKDAAKVFDRLEMPVLIEIASQIAPRKMSDILGLMAPEAAERLTVELARRASGGDRAAVSLDLPKIEGKPTAAPGRN